MTSLTNVETISFLKAHASDLPVNDQPLTITQNGKPAYVVESYEEYQRREQALALLKLVNIGRKAIAEGQTYTETEMMDHLDSLASNNPFTK